MITTQGPSILLSGACIEILRRLDLKLYDVRAHKMLAAKRDLHQHAMDVICVAPILPGVVQHSPILLMLQYDSKTNGTRHAFLPVMTALHMTMQYFTFIISDKKSYKDVDKAYREWKMEGEIRSQEFLEDVAAIGHDPSDPVRVTAFLERCATFTVQMINRNERFLHSTLIGESVIPFALCKTSGGIYGPDALPAGQLSAWKESVEGFWDAKVKHINQQEEQYEIAPTEWISTHHMWSANKDLMWNGIISQINAQEYMNHYTKDL